LAKRSNILLITIDSLRADYLSCLGYAGQTSPNIDQLASEGTLFTNTIANGPRSPASFPSILASIYLSNGAENGLPQEATTLAEVLKKYGYVTAGFCASNPYISSYFGYHRGFDLFQDFLPIDAGTSGPRNSLGNLVRLKRRVGQIVNKRGISDPPFLLFFNTLRGRKNANVTKSEGVQPFTCGETLNEQAAIWLSSLVDKPFFLWIHYMDVHFPYLPANARLRLSDYHRHALALTSVLFKRYAYPHQVILDLYGDRVQDVDKIVAQIVDQLRKQGCYEDTVIILTADHGEEFLEHNGWAHGAKLYDELLRVPLIIRGPGIAPGDTITGQIGLIDLAPTILELVGLEEKVASFQGTSFHPWRKNNRTELINRRVFSEAVHLGGRRPPLWGQDNDRNKLYRIRSCRSETWKYIWDEEGTKQELYHLHVDPKETMNLADSKPGMTQHYQSILQAHFSDIDSAESVTPSTIEPILSSQEEEQIIRRLHDLGYF
jgi:arylsulfatase A-like enzyme